MKDSDQEKLKQLAEKNVIEFLRCKQSFDYFCEKYILIEIVVGLGEKLVSGAVTPNTYFMNKKKHVVEQKSIEFEFDEKILTEISKLGEKIEKHYGKPQDIEFAIHENKIYVLQSRPITTL